MRTNKIAITTYCLYFLGIAFNCLLYRSFEPFYVFIIYQIFFLPLIFIGKYELKIFHITYSISIFSTCISAFFLFFFNDDSQISNDAGNFFRLTSDLANGYSIEEISVVTEGSGAVVFWRFLYNFFDIFSLSKERYIGLYLNSFFVSISGVFLIRIVKYIHGININILYNSIILFSTCSIFWLFSSVHIRDSFIFFIFNLLIYIWIHHIKKSSIVSFFILFLASIISTLIFFTLRKEFIFVPIALLLSFLANKIVLSWSNSKHNYFSVLLILFILFSLFYVQNFNVFNFLFEANQSYGEAVNNESNNSLANALIVSQPLYIRLFLGIIYLFVFPIPIWTGFISTSIISFFKSLNAIYLLFTFPMLILVITNISYYTKKFTTKYMYFLFFTFFGFVSSVALTSLEIRHFGTFFLLYILIISAVEFNYKFEINYYYKLLKLHIIGLLIIHLLWIIIKLV